MAADATILASAVIVLTGLAALVRALLKIRDTINGNTKATTDLTGKLNDLTTSIDGRFDKLAAEVERQRIELAEVKARRR